MNRWNFYEDITGEGSNTYECPDCGFVLQLMEGTPEENEYYHCPKCGAELITDDHYYQNFAVCGPVHPNCQCVAGKITIGEDNADEGIR